MLEFKVSEDKRSIRVLIDGGLALVVDYAPDGSDIEFVQSMGKTMVGLSFRGNHRGNAVRFHSHGHPITIDANGISVRDKVYGFVDLAITSDGG